VKDTRPEQSRPHIAGATSRPEVPPWSRRSAPSSRCLLCSSSFCATRSSQGLGLCTCLRAEPVPALPVAIDVRAVCHLKAGPLRDPASHGNNAIEPGVGASRAKRKRAPLEENRALTGELEHKQLLIELVQDEIRKLSHCDVKKALDDNGLIPMVVEQAEPLLRLVTNDVREDEQ
jgi:hypothetical protein